jgi:hypothetical protein
MVLFMDDTGITLLVSRSEPITIPSQLSFF